MVTQQELKIALEPTVFQDSLKGKSTLQACVALSLHAHTPGERLFTASYLVRCCLISEAFQSFCSQSWVMRWRDWDKCIRFCCFEQWREMAHLKLLAALVWDERTVCRRQDIHSIPIPQLPTENSPKRQEDIRLGILQGRLPRGSGK